MAGTQIRERIDYASQVRIADWVGKSAEALALQAVQDIWDPVPAYRGSGQEADLAAALPPGVRDLRAQPPRRT